MRLSCSIIKILRTLAEKARPNLWFLVSTMIASVTVLVTAHIQEVTVWAATYWLVEAVPERSKLLYFAFVNETTLGYRDIIPVERWHLLGPLAAMNGILMFGWSIAVIFELLQLTIKHLDAAGK
jgi:hypothetical protein